MKATDDTTMEAANPTGSTANASEDQQEGSSALVYDGDEGGSRAVAELVAQATPPEQPRKKRPATADLPFLDVGGDESAADDDHDEPPSNTSKGPSPPPVRKKRKTTMNTRQILEVLVLISLILITVALYQQGNVVWCKRLTVVCLLVMATTVFDVACTKEKQFHFDDPVDAENWQQNDPNQADLGKITKPEDYRAFMARIDQSTRLNKARIKELYKELLYGFSWKSRDVKKKTEELFWSVTNRQCKLFELQGAAKFMLQQLERKIKADLAEAMERVTPPDFGIADSLWRESASLESLGDRVRQLFDWHDDKKEDQREFMAPYFALVQSSGTGKTKLMYELSKRIQHGDEPWQGSYGCTLVLCTNESSAEMDNQVFQHKINFAKIVREYNPPQNEKANLPGAVVAVLEKIMPKEPTKVVVFFDEAQNLLDEDRRDFAFRCICRWLCKNEARQQVVAVFTGTTSALGHSYPDMKPREDIDGVTQYISSRYVIVPRYLSSGDKLYPPFHDTGSVGCLVGSILNNSESASDFDLAVPYGRPLFAMMHEKKQLGKKEASILRRMILSQCQKDPEGWEEVAWISVLATRVQMDLASTQVVTNLVSKGYASLMDFQELQDSQVRYYFARMCILPDPVLARLAMGLMDEEWDIKNDQGVTVYKGKAKQWWVQKMHTLFAGQQCRAPKGNGGELFGALFMLFCMDEVRKELDKDYRTFSVPVLEWIKKMLSNCKVMTDEPDMSTTAGLMSGASGSHSPKKAPSNPRATSTKANTKDPSAKTVRRSTVPVVAGVRNHPIQSSTVNFIQVCHNSFRYPFLQSLDAKSGEGMFKKRFLKYLYNSAIAFYTYQGCPHIDLFASIKICTHKGREIYRPLLVSVRVRKEYSISEAKRDCTKLRRWLQRNAMKRQSQILTSSMKKLNNESRQHHELKVKKEETISGGLCVLIVFGGSDDLEDANDKDLFERLGYIDKEAVAVVIQLKDKDKYELGETLRRTASDRRDVAEISHSSCFLRGHEFTDFHEDDLLRLKSHDQELFGKIGSSMDKWYGKQPHPDKNDDSDAGDEDKEEKKELDEAEDGEEDNEEECEEDNGDDDDDDDLNDAKAWNCS